MPLYDSYVTINGLTLALDGFCKARELLPLLERGRMRGTNFRAASVAGETHRRKVQGAHEVILPLVVFGQKNKNGVAHLNRWVGLRDNIEEIYTTCVDGSRTAPVTCTVTFDDGSTRSGSVECPQMTLDRIDGYRVETADARLHIVLLDGKLT